MFDIFFFGLNSESIIGGHLTDHKNRTRTIGDLRAIGIGLKLID